MVKSTKLICGWCTADEKGCILGEVVGVKNRLNNFRYWLTKKYNKASTIHSHNMEFTEEIPINMPKGFYNFAHNVKFKETYAFSTNCKPDHKIGKQALKKFEEQRDIASVKLDEIRMMSKKKHLNLKLKNR